MIDEWKPVFASDYDYVTPFNLFAHIKHAVRMRNESWDFFFASDRGFGKSASAMSLALMLDPNFSIDNWCFTSEKYIDLITSPQKKGTVVVFDEVGTAQSGSNRKWNDESAHALADIAQVNRTDGVITIGTSLQLDRTEKRLRAGFRVIVAPTIKLSNVETGGKGLAIDCEFRVRDVDVFKDDVRYKLFRYQEGGRIKFVRLFHPPTAMWRAYQVHRADFLDDLKASMAEAKKHSFEKKQNVLAGL